MSENERHEDADTHANNPNEHHKLYHLIYVFGFSVLIALAEVLGLWNFSHFWALVFLAVSLSGFAVFEMTANYPQRTCVKVAAVIGIFAITMALYVVIGRAPAEETEFTGVLEPGSEQTPANACGTTNSQGGTTMVLGDSAVVQDAPGLAWALRVGNCNVLGMMRDQTGITPLAQIYDAKNHLIFRLTGNKITGINGENSTVSSGGDLSTVIVRDGDRNEIFYAHYPNATTLIVRGVFGCPGHEPVAVGSDGRTGGMLLHGGCMRNGASGAAAIAIP